MVEWEFVRLNNTYILGSPASRISLCRTHAIHCPKSPPLLPGTCETTIKRPEQMSGSSSNAVDYAEKNMQRDLELARETTAGGHPNDRTQPALPTVHRKFANPAPLGLLSFATGIFLISIFGVHARDLQTPNVLISVLMFFGGVCQFNTGIMEFVAGNTVCKSSHQETTPLSFPNCQEVAS